MRDKFFFLAWPLALGCVAFFSTVCVASVTLPIDCRIAFSLLHSMGRLAPGYPVAHRDRFHRSWFAGDVAAIVRDAEALSTAHGSAVTRYSLQLRGPGSSTHDVLIFSPPRSTDAAPPTPMSQLAALLAPLGVKVGYSPGHLIEGGAGGYFSPTHRLLLLPHEAILDGTLSPGGFHELAHGIADYLKRTGSTGPLHFRSSATRRADVLAAQGFWAYSGHDHLSFDEIATFSLSLRLNTQLVLSGRSTSLAGRDNAVIHARAGHASSRGVERDAVDGIAALRDVDREPGRFRVQIMTVESGGRNTIRADVAIDLRPGEVLYGSVASAELSRLNARLLAAPSIEARTRISAELRAEAVRLTRENLEVARSEAKLMSRLFVEARLLLEDLDPTSIPPSTSQRLRVIERDLWRRSVRLLDPERAP